MSSINRAKEHLKQGGYTCVMVKNDLIFTSKERGVKPLLDWIDCGADFENAVVADKVVGKAAAFLYVLLKVKEIYAVVLSQPALRVLEKHNIEISYEEKVSAIRNRDNTGNCPMESAVWDVDNPEEALVVIRETREGLLKNQINNS